MRPTLSLAPLRGVTVAAFRRLHAAHFAGVDESVTPFVPLVAGDSIPLRLLNDVQPGVAGSVKTIPQVIGKDPQQLAVMAKALRDIGHTEMNLNCGCPWKFVARKGRGSGLPEDPDRFEAMLDAGCQAMPGGFSVKIRLGMKSSDTLAKRADLIARHPLRTLIIHPRTGVQMYDGTVDLDAFASVVNRFGAIPVVYNGDIRTVADYARIVTRFPNLAGVMIGRGLIANPTLAEQIRAWEAGGRGSIPETRVDPHRTLAFIRELEAEYRATLCGPGPVLGRLKELWGYSHAAFPNGAERLRQVQRARTFDDYERAVAPLQTR